jgi:hypothetical protein
MALQGKSSKLLPSFASNENIDDSLGDVRFRALLSDIDWERLPTATRQRFSKRLADGRTAIYVGEIDEASVGWAGWCFAQAARLIGGPLPTGAETSVR